MPLAASRTEHKKRNAKEDESFASMVDVALRELDDLELRRQQAPKEPRDGWSRLTARVGEAKDGALT